MSSTLKKIGPITYSRTGRLWIVEACGYGLHGIGWKIRFYQAKDV